MDIIKELSKFNHIKYYDEPHKYYIDGIQTLIHFKSSNWCEWYTKNYVTAKKNSLINLLNDIK